LATGFAGGAWADDDVADKQAKQITITLTKAQAAAVVKAAGKDVTFTLNEAQIGVIKKAMPGREVKAEMALNASHLKTGLEVVIELKTDASKGHCVTPCAPSPLPMPYPITD